jgi:hypothetical protein
MNFSSASDVLASTTTTMSTEFSTMTTTTETPPADCPVYDKSDDAIIEMFSFW